MLVRLYAESFYFMASRLVTLFEKNETFGGIA